MTVDRSDQIDQLAAALTKAQAAMSPVAKATANPFFKSKYADLAAVWEAARKPLTENGLSIVQIPTDIGEGRVGLHTLLIHESGQFIGGTAASPIPDMVTNSGKVLPAGPQSVGSAITYLRRYGLSAIAGMVSEDDDGNRTQGRARPAEDRPDENDAVPFGAYLRRPGVRDAFNEYLAAEGISLQQVLDLLKVQDIYASKEPTGEVRAKISNLIETIANPPPPGEPLSEEEEAALANSEFADEGAPEGPETPPNAPTPIRAPAPAKPATAAPARAQAPSKPRTDPMDDLRASVEAEKNKAAGISTPAEAPPAQTAEAHWSEQPGPRKWFDNKVEAMGLSQAEVLKILEVAELTAVAWDPRDTIGAINAGIARLQQKERDAKREANAKEDVAKMDAAAGQKAML